MPDMPLPISRPVGTKALSAALTSVSMSPQKTAAVLQALREWDADKFAKVENSSQARKSGLFAALFKVSSEIAVAIEDIGAAVLSLNGQTAARDKKKGLHHMDWEWLSPDNSSGFWGNWRGHAAPIVRQTLIETLTEADGNPVHIVWTCGSPTFEASVSVVVGSGSVCIVVSTPPPPRPLVHIASGAVGGPPPSDPPEGHTVFYGFARRDGGVVTQDPDVQVAWP